MIRCRCSLMSHRDFMFNDSWCQTVTDQMVQIVTIFYYCFQKDFASWYDQVWSDVIMWEVVHVMLDVKSPGCYPLQQNVGPAKACEPSHCANVARAVRTHTRPTLLRYHSAWCERLSNWGQRKRQVSCRTKNTGGCEREREGGSEVGREGWKSRGESGEDAWGDSQVGSSPTDPWEPAPRSAGRSLASCCPSVAASGDKDTSSLISMRQFFVFFSLNVGENKKQ